MNCHTVRQHLVHRNGLISRLLKLNAGGKILGNHLLHKSTDVFEGLSGQQGIGTAENDTVGLIFGELDHPVKVILLVRDPRTQAKIVLEQIRLIKMLERSSGAMPH